MENLKELYSNDYFSLFSDGTISVSDNVGYVGEIKQEEVYKLYLALNKLFKHN